MELVLVFMFVCAFSLIQADINCGKGQYLDTITRTCSYCSDICFMAQLKRTSEDCAEFCPDYVYEFENEEGGSEAGDVTAIIGITVGALVVIVIAVIIGVLMYRKKCCWQRDAPTVSCGAHLKARLKKCHGTDEEKGENMPLEQLANDKQKETKRKEHQLCQPHDDGSNNKLIPSCSKNEIETC